MPFHRYHRPLVLACETLACAVRNNNRERITLAYIFLMQTSQFRPCLPRLNAMLHVPQCNKGKNALVRAVQYQKPKLLELMLQTGDAIA